MEFKEQFQQLIERIGDEYPLFSSEVGERETLLTRLFLEKGDLSEVAKYVGITAVQVSRLLKRTYFTAERFLERRAEERKHEVQHSAQFELVYGTSAYIEMVNDIRWDLEELGKKGLLSSEQYELFEKNKGKVIVLHDLVDFVSTDRGENEKSIIRVYFDGQLVVHIEEVSNGEQTNTVVTYDSSLISK